MAARKHPTAVICSTGPPGHSVRAEQDTDIVMFSPQHEHGLVIDHIRGQVGG